MKIVCWNIDCGPLTSHYYVDKKYKFSNRLPGILSSIGDEDPDIICLQENPSENPVTFDGYTSFHESTDDIFSVSIHTKVKPEKYHQIDDILFVLVSGIWIINKHNRSRGNMNFNDSLKLFSHVKDLEGPIIICGDFNFYGESDHRYLFSSYTDCGLGTESTWHGYPFQTDKKHLGRSDNFFISKSLKDYTYNIKTNNELSDHSMLILTVYGPR